MNDFDPAWAELDALDQVNDLEGALALGSSTGLGADPRYARYIGWAFAQRQDFFSGGIWYAKAVDLGAPGAEGEFQTCLRELYRAGATSKAAELAEMRPMRDLEGTHRTMLELCFAGGDRVGMRTASLRLAERGRPADVRYAGEVLLAQGEADEAFGLVRRASEGGDRLASQLLGEMYLRGIGTTRSDELAAAAYRAPAQDGFILSRSRLAHLAHRQAEKRFDATFLASMTLILMRTVWLRLVRPHDTRLEGLPK